MYFINSPLHDQPFKQSYETIMLDTNSLKMISLIHRLVKEKKCLFVRRSVPPTVFPLQGVECTLENPIL